MAAKKKVAQKADQVISIPAAETPTLATVNNTELVTLAVPPAPQGPKPGCVCARCKQLQAVKPGQVTRQ